MKKTTTGRLQHIQSLRVRHPNPAPPVFKKFPNLTAPDGEGGERVGGEDLEPGAVEVVQPVLGGHPDEAMPALQNIQNHPLRQAVVDGKERDGCRRLRGQAAGAEEQQG